MRPGDEVVCTRGPLGALRDPGDAVFVDDVVLEQGARAVLRGPHPSLEGWSILEFERDGVTYYVPAFEGLYEAAG